MILNHLLECYLWLCVAVIVHELSHVLAAHMIHLPVLRLCLGEDLFAVRLGKIAISPLMIYGSGVVVSEDALCEKSRGQKMFFFLAGVASNILTVIFAFAMMRWNRMYGYSLLWSSVYIIFMTAIPFCPWQSDVKQLRLHWK